MMQYQQIKSLWKNQYVQQTFCVLSVAIVLMSIILLATCVNFKISWDEYGVFINTRTSSIRGVYEEGTYVKKDPMEQLVIFERIASNNEFIVSCMSSDKLELSVLISLQHQYDKSYIIPTILYQFETYDKYIDFFKKKVTGSIITTCANYSAEDLFIIRGQIEQTIYSNLVNDLNYTDIGVIVKFPQLKDISLPSIFVNAILTKQLVLQNNITQTNKRPSLLVNANTTLFEAQKHAEILLIKANTTANNNIQIAKIESDIILNKWQQRAIAFENIINSLNLSEAQFINYMANLVIIETSPTVNFQDYLSA